MKYVPCTYDQWDEAAKKAKAKKPKRKPKHKIIKAFKNQN